MSRTATLAAMVSLLAVASCHPASPPKTPPKASAQLPPNAHVQPLADSQFATSVRQLLLDRGQSPQRQHTLASAVRSQLRYAQQRFAAEDPVGGMKRTLGGLLLLRLGELHPAMFEGEGLQALEGAYRRIAPSGEEGTARALLQLQLLSLPTNDPRRQTVERRLKIIQRWVHDTRQRSPVEDASADAVADGSAAVIYPTEEELERARASVERWISASLALRGQLDWRSPMLDRDMVLQASRALRTGPILMSALYLRNEDAEGALEAIERSEAASVAPPVLLEALQKAAAGDVNMWRQLAGLFVDDATGKNKPPVIPTAVARGAMWGCTVHAWSLEPTHTSTSLALAAHLANVGLPEVGAAVLSHSFQHVEDAGEMNRALDLLLNIAKDLPDSPTDIGAMQRLLSAAQPLLRHADQFSDNQRLNPSPSRIRRYIAQADMNAAQLDQAAWLLRQVVQTESNPYDYVTLARIACQSPGGERMAEDYTARALQIIGADRGLPALEAHLTAAQCARKWGRSDLAQEHLAKAATISETAGAGSKYGRLRVSIYRAKIAYYSGNQASWKKACERLGAFAGKSPAVDSSILITITSQALLQKSPRTAEKYLDQLAGSAPRDDVAYAALWTMLAQLATHEQVSSSVREALASVDPSVGWPYWLARWGLGRIDDDQLLAHAHDFIQQTEAKFYLAARDYFSGRSPQQALQALRAIGRGPAISLVETDLAREIASAASAGSQTSSTRP